MRRNISLILIFTILFTLAKPIGVFAIEDKDEEIEIIEDAYEILDKVLDSGKYDKLRESIRDTLDITEEQSNEIYEYIVSWMEDERVESLISDLYTGNLTPEVSEYIGELVDGINNILGEDGKSDKLTVSKLELVLIMFDEVIDRLVIKELENGDFEFTIDLSGIEDILNEYLKDGYKISNDFRLSELMEEIINDFQEPFNNAKPVEMNDILGNMIVLLGGNYLPYPKTLKDISNHWARPYIEFLLANNIVNGYKDRTFKPENNITRGEFSKMVVSSLEVELVKYSGEFKDIKGNEWYADYIATIKELGLVRGYTDGTFMPNKKISRAEMAIILSNLLDNEKLGKEETDRVLAQFKDRSKISVWALEAVARVAKANIMIGNKNEFLPNNYATRAEAATTIYRLIH